MSLCHQFSPNDEINIDALPVSRTLSLLMKPALALAVLLLALAQARALVITFDGTITSAQQSGFADFGISPDQSFQLRVAYDDAAVDTMGGNTVGRYVGPWQFTLTAGTREFTSMGGPMTLWTQNSTTDQFVMDYFAQVTDPWSGSYSHYSSLQLVLDDPTHRALHSDALPTGFSMGDWAGGSLRFGGGDGLSGGTQLYDLSANITSVRVPDGEATGPLLLAAFGLLLLGAIRLRPAG